MSCRSEQKVSVELLRSLLWHSPQTGRMFWRERPVEMFNTRRAQAVWNARYARKEAFTARSLGYFRGAVLSKSYLAHRVIWALETGQWPQETIDHINGNGFDNRISNLRDVPQSDNCKNVTRSTDRHPGVYFHGRAGKWAARITTAGVMKHLGLFESEDAAVQARLRAEKNNGFHPNHGRRPDPVLKGVRQ